MEIRPCVISLAHFCERHGPSIVFTTQKIHPTWDIYLFPSSFLKKDNSSDDIPYQKKTRELFPDVGENGEVKVKSPTVEVVLKSNLNAASCKTDPSGKSCSTCSSIPEGLGYISVDETKEWTFISTQNPAPQFYGSVRSGCVKSLSCEFLPGKEGCIIFGASSGKSLEVFENLQHPTQNENITKSEDGSGSEENEEWVFSYAFKIKDSKARGNSRMYSFLLVMYDYLLIHSTTNALMKFFAEIATDIQNRAAKLYEKEGGDQEVDTPAPVRTYGMFRREVHAASLRSLEELIQKKDFYSELHKKFSGLLHSLDSSFYCSSFKSEKEISLAFSLSDFGRLLPSDQVRNLIYCTIVGVQVIVKGSVANKTVVASIVHILQKMIPKQCRKVTEFSTEYKESWECNILGLELNCSLPIHIESNDYAILELLTETGELKLNFKSNVKPLKLSLGLSIEKICFGKTSISEMKQLDVVVKEWISKAKMFYVFSLGIQSDKDAKLKELKTALEFAEVDMVMLKYWGASLKSVVMARKFTKK